MDSTDKQLMKEAALALSTLQSELLEKTASLSSFEMAIKLAFSMYEEEQIAVEQLESKIDELKDKSTEDLKIIQKAMELNKNASAVDKTSLSSRADLNSLKPEDRFIQSLFT